MLGRADRSIVRIAIVIRAIVVIEGRNSKQNAGLECMRPCEVRQSVTFPLHITDTSPLRIRIVGDLIVIAPERRHKSQLIVRVAVVDQSSHAAETPNAIMQYIGTRRL